MSYSTLKDFLKNENRSSGRKFQLPKWQGTGRYFEPIFKDAGNYWHGVDEEGDSLKIHQDSEYNWAPFESKYQSFDLVDFAGTLFQRSIFI